VTHSHHAHAHPPAQGGASPAASAVPDAAHLLAHPDALRLAWAELVAGNAHLHGPEVAQRLGVPEAAMLAARIGHGATELVPDLAALLRPCGQWGKLLLAARNRLGVALMVMDDPQVTVDGDAVTLRTPQHLGQVGVQGAHRCFLFEERDHHGHTLSLNWFDAEGHVIGRLFLMSKSGREVALPHLHTLVLPDQNPLWVPGQTALPALQALANGGAPVVPEPLAVLADGPIHAQPLAEQAVLACAHVPEATVCLQGRGVAVRYSGPLPKAMRTPGAVHASDSACKLHLRMAHASRVAQGQAADGGWALMVDDGDGGQLSLRGGDTAAASLAWVQAVAGALQAPQVHQIHQ
jgi:hypothetical protein